MKYFSSLNLTALASQIVGNLLSLGDTDGNRGFGNLYKWRSLKDGFEEAKLIKKPIFLLIHKLSCPACQKLKRKFSNSMRLIDLSSRFVMINVEVSKNGIGNEEKFQPDGKYVPRILFFTSDGEFIREAVNQHQKPDEEHKYFYSSPSQIVDTMLMVLKNHSKDPLPAGFQDLSQRVSFKNPEIEIPDEMSGPTR